MIEVRACVYTLGKMILPHKESKYQLVSFREKSEKGVKRGIRKQEKI
jgi:hypothetical protein